MKPSDDQPEFKGLEALEAMIAAAPDAPAPPAAVTADLVPTMSSLQIAEITGKRHSDVLRDIANTLSQAGIDERKFASVYLAGNGQERPCYHLPRFECDLLMTGYSVPYRAAVLRRWQELEIKVAAPVMPTDKLGWMELAVATEKKRIESESGRIAAVAEIEVLAPKAEAHDVIAGIVDSFCIRDAAKLLQVRPSVLTDFLDGNKWCFESGRDRVPYQDRIDHGWMRLKVHKWTNKITGEPMASKQSRITPLGLTHLAKILLKKGYSK